MSLKTWMSLGVLCAMVVVGASTVGCSSVAPKHSTERLTESNFPVRSRDPAGISVGSELEFKFFAVPELNDIQVVRADGYVSLQLVGDVLVGGQTPQAVRAHLRDLYAPFLKNPEVVVILRKRAEDRILVAGAVNKPVVVDLQGEMTALDAVLLAGGPDFKTANMRDVVIIREREGKRQGYRIDLAPSLSGELAQMFYLEPKDIVWVPRTTITDVNQFIDQYINKIIPLGFTYTRPLADGTIGIAPGFVRF